MLKLVRRCIGLAVHCLEVMTRPEPIVRSERERKLLAQEVKGLRLYDYRGCPFSFNVRRTLHRLNLDIPYCDIRKCQVHHDDLLSKYGRIHVPVLRIDTADGVQWLDDSQQIIQYLNQRFAPAPSAVPLPD
jgi:Glutathione S-transferase